MNYKLVFISIIALISSTLSAQEPEYKKYQWGSTPTLPQSVNAEKINLKDIEIIEYIFEDEYFFEYQLRHMEVFINSEEQVEANNRKYVPVNESTELVEAKVRVITPENEEIVLDESKILTATDEETGRNYRYFALEGLTPGSIIDYVYVLKKFPSINGERKFIQDEFPTEQYRFEVFSPSHLEFAFKVYNDSTEVKFDSSYSEKNHWVFHAENIEALKEEETSAYLTLLKQLVYKFDKNKSSNSGNQTSFANASSSIYKQMYPEHDKKDLKTFEKFMKGLEIDPNSSTEEKIIAIENYLKDNINLVEFSDPEYEKVSNIIDNKIATERGMIRLLLLAFQQADINVEVLLTSDRSNMIFDEDFESYHYLTTYLLYFPETEQYLVPDKYEYRYPLLPWEATGNKGLFVKETVLGEFKTGIGKVKYIPAQDYNMSYHNIDGSASIADDFSKVQLDMSYLSMGQYAIFIQPYFNLLDDEMIDDFMTDNFKQYFPEGKIDEWSTENGEADFVGKKPFIQSYKGYTTDLIDKAGPNYLFKVGKLIGPQVEMYSESERTLPVQERFKRAFDRELTIEIPEGYTIKNPEALNVEENYIIDGKEVLLFQSGYNLEGNLLTITIHEYYDKLNYTVEEYKDYRRVVNSAADFEKTVLVLQEK